MDSTSGSQVLWGGSSQVSVGTQQLSVPVLHSLVGIGWQHWYWWSQCHGTALSSLDKGMSQVNYVVQFPERRNKIAFPHFRHVWNIFLLTIIIWGFYDVNTILSSPRHASLRHLISRCPAEFVCFLTCFRHWSLGSISIVSMSLCSVLITLLGNQVTYVTWVILDHSLKDPTRTFLSASTTLPFCFISLSWMQKICFTIYLHISVNACRSTCQLTEADFIYAQNWG